MYKKLSLKPLLVAIAATGALNITVMAAAQAGGVHEDPNYTSAPVQVGQVSKKAKAIADKKKVPLKATYSEHVISAKIVRRASPMQNAQTILATKPSINATSAGPNGVRSTITFRAFTSGQFSETFDGIPLNGMFNGGTTNQASYRNAVPLTLNDISGVNIYNGINNPSVNSYNSLGGTINYQPRQPSKTMGGSVGMGYGSFGTFQWNALFNSGSIDGFRSLFAYNRQTSNGWLQNSGNRNTNYYYAGILPYDHGMSKVSAYVIVNNNVGYTPHSVPQALIQQYGDNYNWPLNYSTTSNNDTELTAILGDKSTVSRHVILGAKFYVHNNDYHRTSYANPAFDQSATQPYYLPNQGTGYPFWLSYPVPPTYDPSAIFGSTHYGTDYHLYEGISTALGFSPKAQFILPHNLVTLGGNVAYGMLHSAEYWYGAYAMPKVPQYNNAWDEHDSRLMSSVYMQDNISLLHGMVHITPGIKYLYAYTVSSDDIGFYYPIGGSVANSQAFTSPTIGISYAPLHGLSFYGSWGRNIKFPNIGAYYSNIAEQNNAGQYVIAPVTVQPEYVTDYELGTRYRHDGFKGSVDAYLEQFKNTFLTNTNSSGISNTYNGGSSRYEGVELALEQRLGHFLLGHWAAFANYSYNQAVFTSSFNSTYAGSVLAGQPLANVPKNMFNVGLNWGYHHIHAHIDGKYVSTQYVNQQFAGTPTSQTIPSYFLLNLGVEDTIPIHTDHVKSVKLSLNIDNLLNRHYFPRGFSNTDYYGNTYLSVLQGMPRFVFGSVTLKF